MGKRRKGGVNAPPSAPGGQGQANGAAWGEGMPADDLPQWQKTGYHMEDAPCDGYEPLDERNDTPYEVQDVPTLPDNQEELDPMAQTGEDESLAMLRSEQVRNHSGSFWEKMSGFTQRHRPVESAPVEKGASAPATDEGDEGDATATGATSGPVTPAKTQPGGNALLLFVIVLCILGCGLWLIDATMFRITEIEVAGNSIVPASEVIRLSGLSVGGSVLTIDEKKIGEQIATNRYLKLACVEHDNKRVTLRVSERVPAAYTVVRGIYYTLDNRGMVLEEYASDEGLADLVKVDKLPVKSCVVGKYLTLQNDGAMEAFVQLMLEIKAMSLQSVVRELYLDDLESISLDTRDGFFVRMGDESHLHGKLRAMALTRTELLRLGKSGGTIDVSTRTNPTYSPPVAGIGTASASESEPQQP